MEIGTIFNRTTLVKELKDKSVFTQIMKVNGTEEGTPFLVDAGGSEEFTKERALKECPYAFEQVEEEFDEFVNKVIDPSKHPEYDFIVKKALYVEFFVEDISIEFEKDLKTREIRVLDPNNNIVLNLDNAEDMISYFSDQKIGDLLPADILSELREQKVEFAKACENLIANNVAIITREGDIDETLPEDEE